jgi:hypothetical protein
MFQKLFTTLYQALLGTAEPSSLIPVYQKSIFPGVGLGTLFGVALGAALLFYVIFNRVLTTSFYKTSHWFIMLLLTAIGSAILAYSQARSVVYASLDGETLGAVEKSAYDRYVLGVLVVNALYGALFFILWSFVVKPLSVSARTTPVRWPN